MATLSPNLPFIKASVYQVSPLFVTEEASTVPVPATKAPGVTIATLTLGQVVWCVALDGQLYVLFGSI